MPIWQIALMAFVLAWIVQSIGVWRQTRHYTGVMRRLRTTWGDGKLGAGAAQGRFGKGVIAIVVVDPAKTVRSVQIMQGRSVFAEFKPLPDFDGLPLEAAALRLSAGAYSRGVSVAVGKAIEQIEKIGAADAGSPLAGSLRPA